MPKVLFFSKKSDDNEKILSPLKEVGFIVSQVENENNIVEEAEKFLPDVVLLAMDTGVDEISKLCRKIRLIDQNSDVQILLIVNANENIQDISQVADGYIAAPIDTSILISMINSHLRLKSRLDIFSSNNNEIAEKFYQLKVLYDTNSKLAGTLSPRKLIDIMNEGLEHSISYSLGLILLINNPKDVLLIINSLYPITKRLEQALKLRSVMAYKGLFADGNIPFPLDINDVRTEINYKTDEKVYDSEVMKYSGLFSSISTQDKFFGTVEILRDTELSNEDTACFQTVVSQVALPLESAILYQEINEKNERLTKLEKLKSEFISIVSHELRTPLTAIRNALDIILSGKTGELTDKMTNFLSMGKRNVVRLSGIINDLLDLSKIEAGKMEYHFEKTNLTEPLSLAVSTFNPMAIDKNITLKLVLGTQEAFVYADAQRIEQIVANLISNALKFTEAGGKVAVKLEEDKTYSASWLVTVEDTGIGISEENLTKVFDKFSQIESSLVRNVGGTGLGLPIAKEFVQAHGGQIWAERKKQKGTRFCFLLPKYDEYQNFLIELGIFYEKSKSANANFGIVKIKTSKLQMVIDFIEKEGKYRKIFTKENRIFLLTQNLNKNLYELYLEKLQDFAYAEKNANMLVHDVYCDFKENKSLNELVAQFDTVF